MTATQILMAIISPLALLLFGIFVKYFIKLVDDVGEIKTFCEVQTLKHEHLEKRVQHIENKLEEA